MEELSSVSTAPQVAPVAAPTPVAATPAPAVTPSFEVPQPAPSGGGTFGFLKEINWLEVTLMALAAYAAWMTIGFYRYRLKEDKTAYGDVYRRVDMLEQKVNSFDQQAQSSQQQPAQPFF